jgi:O-antigen/teichoic acid export membrane protein
MLLRAVAQATAVLVLARLLGAEGYGQLVAVFAVASFVSPFVGLGLSNIVLRNGAKDPGGLWLYRACALRVLRLTLLPAIVVACLLALLLLPDDIPRVAAFCAIAGELAATSLVELRARDQQALHRVGAFGAINAGLPVVRLIALLFLYVLVVDPNVQLVLWVYSGASAAYAVSLWLPIGKGQWRAPATESMSLTEGVPFCMASFAMRLQAEFNKPVLAHLGFDLVGTYNAAQRAIDLASMPSSAFQESLWPRLYAENTDQRRLRVAGMLLLLLAVGCGVAVWLIAPILPLVLGDDFANAVGVARCLALLPLLQSMRALLSFHVIRRDYTQLIGWAYAMGAVASVVGVMMLVPGYGIMGAVISTYVAEGAMMIVLMAGISRSSRKVV